MDSVVQIRPVVGWSLRAADRARPGCLDCSGSTGPRVFLFVLAFHHRTARCKARAAKRLRLAAHPGKLMQAVALRAALLGIPYLTSCWPLSAAGTDKLETVTLRRGARTWTERCDYQIGR